MNNTLRLFIKGKSENKINPLLYDNSVDLWLMGCIYQGIMMFNDDLVLIGRLSQSLICENDYKSYILTLKEGLKWNDGHSITTEDILFTIQWLLQPEAPDHLSKYFLNIISAKNYKTKSTNDIEGIKLIDDYRIQFLLEAPDPYFNQRLLLPIIPKHIFENVSVEDFYNNRYKDEYIGSGPYKLIKKESSKFLFSKNEYFHLGTPYIDHMTIETGSNDELIDLLKNRSIDFAEISYSDIDSVSEYQDHYKYYGLDKPMITLIALNHRNKMLKNKSVRKSIAYAIHKKKIIAEIYKGYAHPIEQYYPNILNRYKAELLNDYHYDIELGKIMLQNENLTDIQFNLGYNATNSEHKFIAEFVKKMIFLT
ncbi:ABC transporter substrate-binding protein [Paenibacillus sp. WLX1005]|uniref:ABC transporter substrate-binding protein n=1 Tax=Paenibacillus sp. WLX1005 TaxID=3243766 RepID=UPI003983E3E6